MAMEKKFVGIGEKCVINGVRLKCVAHTCCDECIIDKFSCADVQCFDYERQDGQDSMFVIDAEPDMAEDIRTLERIAKDYPAKTIENIIYQLKTRLK